eukprot:CAMPEP_0181215130 /NCGR_PEP_ID=MMETSP1096-20121128/25843_1 /TAXON_ID=156174 ORGANISM="Chrysochromulina ericina, Strain CCMP281" /NCGR_SAMPLE_ID=MMETSP1096 /ASSEMBLY_ACC=CAM_ASM_000453 /LENGTH=72 /DNA_ID=CAMNT_0023306953 /DNA_START=173 /DNA_END=387 /DNA_ORIENTATION=+
MHTKARLALIQLDTRARRVPPAQNAAATSVFAARQHAFRRRQVPLAAHVSSAAIGETPREAEECEHVGLEPR